MPRTAWERAAPLPAVAGVGLRAPHYREILATRPRIGWFEAHSENYFGEGGQPLAVLDAIRAEYAVSLHGVGLSLGSSDPLDAVHLAKLKRLVERVEPCFVSEHLSWSSIDGRFYNELLPLPYSEEALRHMIGRVGRMQDALGRRVLIENITTYVTFHDSSIHEGEFLNTLARASGCGLLLDVNNVYVNSVNHGFDPRQFIAGIDAACVEEIHLAGFSRAGGMLVDTHGARVCDAVWKLYEFTLGRIGPRPTLIEWDNDLPVLGVLLDEARRAEQLLERQHVCAA
jgi:hypothetical protein